LKFQYEKIRVPVGSPLHAPKGTGIPISAPLR